MSHYQSADSPRNSDRSKEVDDLIERVSREVRELSKLPNELKSKRTTHGRAKNLIEQGNKLVERINGHLKQLTKAAQKPEGRPKRAQIKKLSADFKAQCEQFEAACEQAVQAEEAHMDRIRRSRNSSQDQDQVELGNYDEEQIYAQVAVTRYNDEDLARREEDIVDMNHRIKDVKTAYAEVDALVEQQGEQVAEIVDNTDDAQDHVERGLDNFREADRKKGLCNCTTTKKILWAILAVLIIAVVIALVTSLK